MRRPAVPQLFLLFVTTLLAARVMWHLAVSPSGTEPHLTAWNNLSRAVLPGFTEPAPSLTERDPADQARFWLRKVERIKGTRTDPQLALGAAWLLDRPAAGYLQHTIQRRTEEFADWLPVQMSFELDEQAIAAAEARFELACREECREQMEAALRLQPDNVNLWRTRALLLFQDRTFTVGLNPRWNEWQALLDEASRHDPDNAMYDYLAAAWLWSKAATYERLDGLAIDGLTVHDSSWLEEARSRMQAGLARPSLRFGEGNYPAILSFLQQSSLPRPQYPAVLESRRDRANSLLMALLRLHGHEMQLRMHRGEFAAARETARDLLHIADQLTQESGRPAQVQYGQILRQFALTWMVMISEEDPGSSNDRLAGLRQQKRDAELQYLVLSEAGQHLLEGYPQDGQPLDRNRRNAVLELTATVAQLVAGWMMFGAVIVAVALLCAGLVLWTLWTAFRRAGPAAAELPGVAWYRQAIAWILGPATSFIVLGLCPAGVISTTMQGRVLKVLVLLCSAALAILAVRWLSRRLRIPFRQALTLMAVSALLTAIVLQPSQSFGLIRDALAGWPMLALLAVFGGLLTAGWIAGRQIAMYAHQADVPPRRRIAVAALLLVLPAIGIPAGAVLEEPVARIVAGIVPVPFSIWPEAAAMAPTVDELQRMSDSPHILWSLAGIEWMVYQGPVTGAILAVLIVLLPLLGRHPASGNQPAAMAAGPLAVCVRSRWSMALRSCGMACLVFSAFCLAATPTVMQLTSSRLEQRIDWWRRSAPTINEFDEAVTAVRANDELMDRLRAAARESEVNEQ